MSAMLPRLFFDHFNDTSFIIEEDGQIMAFLIGFFSQCRIEEAYIHFVGVHPQYRKRGFGQAMYARFFEIMQRNRRSVVRCVTSPVNTGSIAFHTRMGFQIEPGEINQGGLSYHPNYDGTGEPRVCFVRHLGQGCC